MVSKEKEKHTWMYAFPRLLVEIIQLFLIVVNPRYGFDIDPTNKWVPSHLVHTVFLQFRLGAA